jgi:hypothetical protein
MIDGRTWMVYTKIERGKLKCSEERSSQYTGVHHKYNMDCLGIKPRLDP